MKKPAHRGATAGLSNAFLAVRDERFTAPRPLRQDVHLAHRFGLPLSTAAVIAELAFPQIDSWRGAR